MFWFVLFLFVFLSVLKLYQKLTCGICKCSAHLVGKTAVVTGANTGIGYETALDYAARGARVILACRSESRARGARDKIVAATNNQQVLYKQLNLASLQSVRAFAVDFLQNEERLDILVNNAGAGGLGNTLTADGLQLGMQVNYFGPYLLTRLLEPLLRRSTPSRIVNVSSEYHRFGKLDVSNLNMERQWSDVSVYANSKLFNILMTAELSRRLAATGVVANSLHPGVVATEIFRNIPSKIILGSTNYMLNLLFKSPWEGAQTSIYLAVAPEMGYVSGKYFSDCREAIPSRAARDAELARKLWEQSEQLVKFI